MIRGSVVPRLPYVIRPIQGVPGPLLPPLVLDESEALDGATHAWATLLAHIHALHSLYGRAGHRRPMGRLHDLTLAVGAIVRQQAGGGHARAAARVGTSAAYDVDLPARVLAFGGEAGWWVVALQASYALSVWHGLADGLDAHDVDAAQELGLKLRRALVSVFSASVVDAICDAAHGDGQGDLLALVARGALDLGAPLVGLPKEA